MLGWGIVVYRRPSGSEDPGSDRKVLARWETGVAGLNWIKDLVKSGKAVYFSEGGYPNRYTFPAGVLLGVLRQGLPVHNSLEVFGDDYHSPVGWNGMIEIDRVELEACNPEEVLFLDAWDLS